MPLAARRQLARRLLVLLAAAAGFGLTIWAYYPGLLSFDSLWQLNQARDGFYNDHHPPVMAWLWHGLDRVLPGPGGMLLLQAGVFWFANAVLWLELTPSIFAGLGVLAFGLLPPVFGLLGTIWKDVQMGVALFAAFALLLGLARRGRRVGLLAVALGLLWYAAAVRINGILAAAPLLWLWVRVGFPSVSGRRALLATLALTASVFASGQYVNARLTDRQDHSSQEFEAHDLVGLSLANGVSLFPEAYWAGRAPLTLGEMRAIYMPVEPSSLFWDRPEPHLADFLNPPSQRPAEQLNSLRVAWLHAIWDHPRQWLGLRAHSLRKLFGLDQEAVCYAFQPDTQASGPEFALRWPDAHARARGWLDSVRNGLLFRGWLYSVLLLLIALFHAVGRARLAAGGTTTLAVAVSGLGNLSIYPLVGAGCDFRYLWWSVVASLLAGLVFFSSANRLPIKEGSDGFG